jgi:fructose-1,6-bisphosphatase/inositol monophosphatase family enzyme
MENPMPIESIADMVPHVQQAGRSALNIQRAGTIQKSLKPDGSVVTQADTQVEAFLLDKLTTLYPEANILTEETTREYDPGKAYTFALDPIDGTEIYSRGMAGWCVSLALLDQKLLPIAGIIYAPVMELLIVADVGASPTINGRPAETGEQYLPLGRSTNIMVTSQIHRHLDLSAFPGKIRSIGSAELHLCFPVVYPDIVAGFQNPNTYIWDIAAAHAISTAAGYRCQYFDGSDIDYRGMADGGKASDLIMSGPKDVLEALGEIMPRIKPTP